jgi:hypothetical protein
MKTLYELAKKKLGGAEMQYFEHCNKIRAGWLWLAERVLI